jgi:predicted nucleotidyltransferase
MNESMSVGELLQQKQEEILHLAAKHGASNVRIFGSVARGEDRLDSDVDFLVEIEAGRSLLDHIALIQDLEDLLGRMVDVAEAENLHWYIRDRILQEAIAL